MSENKSTNDAATAELLAASRAVLEWFGIDELEDYPTISRLADAIKTADKKSDTGTDTNTQEKRVRIMSRDDLFAMVRRYHDGELMVDVNGRIMYDDDDFERFSFSVSDLTSGIDALREAMLEMRKLVEWAKTAPKYTPGE